MAHHDAPQPSEPDGTTTVSRRRFLQGGLAAAAVAALALPHDSSEAATVQSQPRPTPPAPLGGKRQNILIILCDQMRFPPFYESETLRDWRLENLNFQNQLRANGLDFQRHYIMSSACVPSRASILTGHYPSLHGTSQTVGGAKEAYDAEAFWLAPRAVPTFGHYFRAAGYSTFWVGKWHASAAEMLIPGTHVKLLSYDPDTGARDPAAEALYKAANQLEPFGFAGWIGPEPHGSSPLDSGSSVRSVKPGQPIQYRGRDVSFAEQAQELIQELDEHPKAAPWLAVCSFTNPHDIACWGLYEQHPDSGFEFNIVEDPTDGSPVPANEDLFKQDFELTVSDNLATKPSAQLSYREKYHIFQQPILEVSQYHRYYYQLHKNVDDQMLTVFNALLNSRYKENTFVVFTSDHGELLGAHSDMHQKFYQAYDETIRVPLIIWHSKFPKDLGPVPTLTSHADLAPTLLGLAGIPAEPIRQALEPNHSDAVPFVGRDLSPLILGLLDAAKVSDPIYFMTDDAPDRGPRMKRFIPPSAEYPQGLGYFPVEEPNSIETVIARLDDGHLWKFSRYFDNPQYWSSPGTQGDDGVEDVLQVQVEGNPPPDIPPPPAIIDFAVTVKATPKPDEFEMYQLDEDPLELTNRYGVAEYSAQQQQLEQLLAVQRTQKRLTPCSGNVPGQDCNRSPVCDQPCPE
jgi:choline-sulfatase